MSTREQRLQAAQLGADARYAEALDRILREEARRAGLTVEQLVLRLGPARVREIVRNQGWLADWEDRLRERLDELTAKEVAFAAGRAAADLPPRARVSTAFDAQNPWAVAYARDAVPDLVTNVTQDTLDSLGEVIYRGFSEQRTVDWMAREMRQVIGLTTRQADQVMNLRRTMEESGATDAAVERTAQAVTDKLVRQRADTIARTETIRTSTQGTLAAWAQAVEAGVMPDGTQKRWIAGGGCPICEELAAEDPIDLDEDWDGPDGALDGPPAHPNCRCTVGLVFP